MSDHLSSIARKCLAAYPSDGAQMVVLSIGMGLEVLVFRLLELCEAAGRLRIVALPDHFMTDGSVGRRLAESFALLSEKQTSVHVFVDGTSPKQRCDAYNAAAGIIVTYCRLLCADLLHKRLSAQLVSACVIILPASVTPSKMASCANSVAFVLEIMLQSNSIGGEGVTKLFVATDSPCSMAAASRSSRGGVMTQWRCSDLQLFPNIRVDVIDDVARMAAEGGVGQWTRTRTPMTRSTIALQALLRKILSEVIVELQQLDLRRHQPMTVAVRKRSRVTENNIDCKSDTDWWEGTNPVGVDFETLSTPAVLAGAINGLDSKIKNAMKSPLLSVRPYRPLLKSLVDVRGLLSKLGSSGAADFLLHLEEAIVSRTADNVVHNDGNAAWTLSDSFADVVTLAASRVYRVSSVQSPQSEVRWSAIDVDAEDPEEMEQLLPVAEEISPKLLVLKHTVLSWCRSKKNAGELLVVVNTENSFFRVINSLTHSGDDFARIELNKFLASYQNMFGVSSNIPPRQASTNLAPGGGMAAPAPRSGAVLRSAFVPFQNSGGTGTEKSGKDEDDESLLLDDSDDDDRVHDGIREAISEMMTATQGSVTSSTCSSSSLHHILLSHKPLKLTQQGKVKPGDSRVLELTVMEDRSALLTFPGRPCAVRVLSSQILDAVSLRALVQGPGGPQRIIAYEGDLQFLRTVETYQNLFETGHPGAGVRTSLELVREDGNMTEDETRLFTMAQELQAIKQLARVKQDITSELFCNFAAKRNAAAELESGDISRRRRRRQVDQQQGPVQLEVPSVVFDEREFRSSLPYELFKRGIAVTPLTLLHGDYVLSPHHCVERKSLTDLTQSLQSGRLHNQLAALSRLYSFPILLVEFDRNIPFRLCYSTTWRSTTTGPRMSLMLAKVAKVVSVLPRVTWIWSRSPAHTADMMLKWKTSFARGNMNIGDSALTSASAENVKEDTRVSISILSRFPGVTSSNIQRLMQLCGSLQGLAALSRESLVATIGESDGTALHKFLHEKIA